LTKRNTHLWLLGALAFAVGTPALLGLLNSGSRFYLLQPGLFLIQAIPYLVAGALWLPWRSSDAARTAGILARALFFAAAVFYATMLTGIFPVGGDMIGLGFLLIALFTIALVVAGTVVAFAWMWVRRRDQTRV
jgi:hypothetical protein